MKLAISNFAWDFSENNEIFNILKKHQISNIEGVLTKIDNWGDLNTDKIRNFKTILDENGLMMESAQSIFYGVNCDGLHDGKVIIPHIKNLVEYSKILGIKTLVLGSPNLRKNTSNLLVELSKTFKVIDGILEGSGVEISLEPNTKNYGGDYFHNLTDIVIFISENNFKNIKTMIDTHNLIMEGIDPCNEIIKYFDKINHIHISEPELKPITDTKFHLQFSNTIKSLNYNKIITYELLKCENLESTIEEFKFIYY